MLRNKNQNFIAWRCYGDKMLKQRIYLLYSHKPERISSVGVTFTVGISKIVRDIKSAKV